MGPARSCSPAAAAARTTGPSPIRSSSRRRATRSSWTTRCWPRLGRSSGPTTLAAGAYLVLVSDYAAFDSRYHVAANAIPVAGVYSGNLSNNGDAIKLFQVGEADPLSGYVPYYRVDYVNFEDHAPWPAEPDGTGSPLNRLDVNQYGNDPINWIAGGWRGTPGQRERADRQVGALERLPTSPATSRSIPTRSR